MMAGDAFRPPALVPLHALHSLHVSRFPASLLAGQTNSPCRRGSFASRTRKVLHPFCHASWACPGVSQLAITRRENRGSHVLHWCVYPVWAAATLESISQISNG